MSRSAVTLGCLGVLAALWAFSETPSPGEAARNRGIAHDRTRFDESLPVHLTMPGGGTRAVASLLNVQAPMGFGDYRWDDPSEARGPVWIRVDLARQMLSVFRGGDEIGSAVILYGTNGTPTPSGRFSVIEKRRVYRSRRYNAPMPYMLRLTNDGIAIHATNVRDGHATHGCIGVPDAFAQRLFAVVSRGDSVAILAKG